MTDFNRRARNAIKARRDWIVGQVVSAPGHIDFDASAGGAPTLVARVDVGRERLLEDVPIKMSNGDRSYARAGSSVRLERVAGGSWEIVGPSDKLIGTVNRTQINPRSFAEAGTESRGFTFETVAFQYYQGIIVRGDPELVFTQVGSAPDTIVRSAGDFLEDGFRVGQEITVSDTASNDGAYTLSGVTINTLSIDGDLLTNETLTGATVLVADTILWADGVTPFNQVLTLDADGDPV